MANVLQQLELDGLRQDFNELLGDGSAGGDAKTTIAITRTTVGSGDVDRTTLAVTPGSVEVIYTGEAFISPIVFRRDRQEIAGGEAQRIRQYRMLLPWDSGNILIDDIVEVISSQDPQFVNRKLTVSDVMYETELAARRVTLTDTGVSDEAC
jgi:hypothetical protein